MPHLDLISYLGSNQLCYLWIVIGKVLGNNSCDIYELWSKWTQETNCGQLMRGRAGLQMQLTATKPPNNWSFQSCACWEPYELGLSLHHSLLHEMGWTSPIEILAIKV